MSTGTPVKSVKDSKNRNFRPFMSDKNTPPLNDTYRVDEKTKEVVLVAGLSDEQKIAEGYQAPHQYKTQWVPSKDKEGNIIEKDGKPVMRQQGRFEKDSFERKELKRLAKGVAPISSNGSVNPRHHGEPQGTLIVHLVNKHKPKDFKDFKKEPANTKPQGFKTTYSFKNVRQSEIFHVLSTIIYLDRNVEDDEILNHVVKYHFNGKTYPGKAKKV